MRLDSFLVKAKIASKKDAKRIIRKKNIILNNEMCNLPAKQINENDIVKYNNEIIPFPSNQKVYYMFNKPQDIIMDRDYESEYPNFQEFILDLKANNELKPAGRLSLTSNGLIILTNDGELIHRLTHPKHKITKKYFVESRETLQEDQILAIRSGFKLYDGTIIDPIKIEDLSDNKYLIEFYINVPHLIKKIFKTFGNWVITQKRIKIGNLELDNSLKEGHSRELKKNEIDKILTLVNLNK